MKTEKVPAIHFKGRFVTTTAEAPNLTPADIAASVADSLEMELEGVELILDGLYDRFGEPAGFACVEFAPYISELSDVTFIPLSSDLMQVEANMIFDAESFGKDNNLVFEPEAYKARLEEYEEYED